MRDCPKDMFSLEDYIKPQDIYYEWKSLERLENPKEKEATEKAAWLTVPASRHVDIFTENDDWVIRKGMILMERPVGAAIEARKEEFRKNKKQLDSVAGRMLDNAKASLPEGTKFIGGAVMVKRWPPDPEEHELTFTEHGAVTNEAYRERVERLKAQMSKEELEMLT